MLVLDTSVAVKWVVPEDDSHREKDIEVALALLERGLIAPELIWIEFANAMRKKLVLGEVGLAQAHEAILLLPDLVQYRNSTPLSSHAFELALELHHPVQDCLFLALAVTAGAPLVTADRKFVRRCANTAYESHIFDLAEKNWR